jgi:antitoxin component YwqK of YwqJK toxin-antitoxin module
MSTTSSPTKVKTLRSRWPLWLGLLALVAGLTLKSHRKVADAEAGKPPAASVARERLENRGGRFYRPGADAPFSGWITDQHPSGEMKLRSAVLDGRLHGISEGWSTNGVPELRERFQRGLPHGTRVTWHANGKKRSEGQLLAGQQQGLYRQWDEEGKLVVEAEFEAGKPHGLSRAWYSSGYLKAEAMMKHGEVQARHVYPDGNRQAATLVAGNLTP